MAMLVYRRVVIKPPFISHGVKGHLEGEQHNLTFTGFENYPLVN